MTSSDRIASSEITPASVYFNRRAFMNAGITAVSLVATGKVYRALNHPGAETIRTPELAPSKDNAQSETGRISRGLLGDDEPLTPLKNITNYNNFYEFTTDKETVSAAAARFVARPWEISVEGMVHKPGVFGLDDILKTFPVEERVYRMRCVEGWSMVIPWSGFSLSKLLERVEPLGGAKYVAFESLFDPKRMPNQESAVLPWPYVEGLRMDESMHPLTILAVGLYGHELPPQNGAPLRLVVPWKYGFKGIKSIVKIRVVAERPASTWNITGPREYGFYSNVNPEVDHPRWSQATEQRIGEIGRRPTLLFNGYGSQVAHLYTGMDLRKNY